MGNKVRLRGLTTDNIVFKTYQPHKLLQPYISKIFAFETKAGLTKSEFSLIAPNGEVKLVIPYKNNMRSTIGGKEREHKEASCFVIGLTTQAALIDCDQDYGNLCVEFKPQGAYRFFDDSMRVITNGIYDTNLVFNQLGAELQQRIAEIPVLEHKVQVLQQFLIQRLSSIEKSDPITDYAVGLILSRNGLIRVNDLCAETGYSRRYLYNKFEDSIGLSPKEYICIIRFNHLFKSINLAPSLNETVDELYYDQSHFIKEFKRFTGYTPGEYLRLSNNLGTIFFQE